MPFDALNVCLRLLMGACQGSSPLFALVFRFGGPLKAIKSHFEFRLLSRTVAAFIRRHHCWLLHNNVAANEWMNDWMSGEWSKVKRRELRGFEWRRMVAVALPATTMFSIRYKTCTCHAQRRWHQHQHQHHRGFPQAMLGTTSSLFHPLLLSKPSLFGSHVLHLQQRHSKNWLISQIPAGKFPFSSFANTLFTRCSFMGKIKWFFMEKNIKNISNIAIVAALKL